LIADRHIFITGGAGFLGTALCRVLADGNRITVFDNMARDALTASGLAGHPNVTVRRGDLLEPGAIRDNLPADVDIVVHMAAVAGVDNVLRDPVTTLEVNMIGTYNLLRTIDDAGLTTRLERLVAFSTSEVFGVEAFRVSEISTMTIEPLGEARWGYALSKLASEHLVHAFVQGRGLRGVVVRPFNIYGPGQVGEGAIQIFVKQALAGGPITVHGDGDQIRSWCYVDDMIDGIVRCMVVPAAVGQVFNLGNPRGTVTTLGLARMVRDQTGGGAMIQHVPQPYVDVDVRVPNIAKARDLLGFEPAVELDDGLARTIEGFRSEK